MENYASIEDVRITMGDSFKEDQAAYAGALLTDASAGLRQIFKNHGLNLAERISGGELEETIVKRVVVDMVVRNLSGSLTPLGGDFSQFSQSAGGYSINVSSNGSNLYLKREQSKWLGLPNISVNRIKLF